jgi:VanZ family protein
MFGCHPCNTTVVATVGHRAAVATGIHCVATSAWHFFFPSPVDAAPVNPMRAETPTNPTSRLRRLWLSAGVVLVVLVLYLSLRPEPAQPPPQGLDKFEHLLAYGVLMFWFAHLEPVPSGRWRLALGLAGMGVAIECLQGLVGHRQFSVADMLANGVGVSVGWLAAPPRAPDALQLLEARASRGRN